MIVGRRQEHLALRDALDSARAGRGRLVVLVGEPGIGKTTLADAISADARVASVVVAWGRCWEPGGAPAFWPWTQALSALLDAHRAPDGVIARCGPDLLRVVPDLGQDTVAPGPIDPESARFAVARAVTKLLRSLPPSLVVLDDLHAADHASLDLLHAIARELRTLPHCIVTTHRDADVALTDDVAARLAAIAREGTILHVPRLAAEDTAELVHHHLANAGRENAGQARQAPDR